jgi:hypothetical protein
MGSQKVRSYGWLLTHSCMRADRSRGRQCRPGGPDEWPTASRQALTKTNATCHSADRARNVLSPTSRRRRRAPPDSQGLSRGDTWSSVTTGPDVRAEHVVTPAFCRRRSRYRRSTRQAPEARVVPAQQRVQEVSVDDDTDLALLAMPPATIEGWLASDQADLLISRLCTYQTWGVSEGIDP